MSEPTLGKTPTLAIETIARDLAASVGLTSGEVSLWHLAAACVALDFLPRYAAERMAADLVAGRATEASVDRWLRGHLIAGLGRMQAELRSLRAAAAKAPAAGPNVVIAGAEGHKADAAQPQGQLAAAFVGHCGGAFVVLAGKAVPVIPVDRARECSKRLTIATVQRHLAASLDVGGRQQVPQQEGQNP